MRARIFSGNAKFLKEHANAKHQAETIRAECAEFREGWEVPQRLGGHHRDGGTRNHKSCYRDLRREDGDGDRVSTGRDISRFGRRLLVARAETAGEGISGR